MTETASPGPTRIVFGTDGWRARIAEDFSFENVRRCADGVARCVVERGDQAKGVVIAYDRRFASEHFARAAAEVLLAHDIGVAISRTAVPTQMSSYEVVQRGSAAGIVITASHNPWTDNGFKVKSPTGAAAGSDMLPTIEAGIAANAGRAIDRRPLEDAEAAGLVEWFDPFEGYQRYVGRTLDLDALRAADMSVLVEPLYGAGSGWIPRLLAGGRIRVTEVHNERNPYFGGINPEPIRPNVDEALALIAGGGYDLGLLLDGDADRAGASDERGTFLHQLEVTSLLMYYLAEYRGMREPVVVSVNNTSTAAHAREALRDRDARGPGGLQVHRAEDDRDGRDARRRGVGRLRVRDAPARARRHLRRPVPARPVPARARAWPSPGVAGDGGVPRARRAVVLPPDRRPLRPALVRRRQAARARRAARVAAELARREPRSPGPSGWTPATA